MPNAKAVEKNPLYKPLKSVEGETVGYACIECGRSHIKPHRDHCSLGAEKTRTPGDDLWAAVYTLEHWKPETPHEASLLDVAVKLIGLLSLRAERARKT